MIQTLIEAIMILALYVFATYGIMSFYRTIFYKTEPEDEFFKLYGYMALGGTILIMMLFTVPLFSLS